MSASASIGAAKILSLATSLLSDLGALYAIPLAIAAFAAVVGVLSGMLRG